eukprot:5131526-Amphidinium_carterae.1
MPASPEDLQSEENLRRLLSASTFHSSTDKYAFSENSGKTFPEVRTNLKYSRRLLPTNHLLNLPVALPPSTWLRKVNATALAKAIIGKS